MSKKPLCVILGGGGHARSVVDAVRMSECAELVGVLDKDSELWGKEVLNVPVLGGDEALPALIQKGVTCFAVGLGAVKDNQPRRKLYDLGVAHRLTPLTVRHPGAHVSPSARIGSGTVLLAGVVVGAAARVGHNVILNSASIIEHDCVVGHHAHIASGAILGGAVCVANLAHVGAGAVIRQGLSIGESAVVGAGAVVTHSVEPGRVVAGVPARELNKPEIRTASSESLV